MSKPPQGNLISPEIKTYVIVDVHDRVRQWTGSLVEIFREFSGQEKAFFICDDGGIVQLLYVVSIDPEENWDAEE